MDARCGNGWAFADQVREQRGIDSQDLDRFVDHQVGSRLCHPRERQESGKFTGACFLNLSLQTISLHVGRDLADEYDVETMDVSRVTDPGKEFTRGKSAQLAVHRQPLQLGPRGSTQATMTRQS